MCGLGQWGPNLLRNLREAPGCAVTALCDNNPARLQEFAPSLPGAALHNSFESLAADKAVDAVVLATPAGLHEVQVETLLSSGKDVLVEKPLALSTAAAARLVALARSLGRVLMVGHTFLFNPAVIRAGEELRAGTLGAPRLILAQRLSLGRVRDDCNALWNLAPHDMSILLHWLGELPTSVTARGTAFLGPQYQEDVALCVLEFPGNVMASVQVSWMNPVKVRQMTIVGSERMMVYDDVDSATPLRLYHRRIEEAPHDAAAAGSMERWQLQIRQGKEEVLPVGKDEPLAREVAHFVDCVRDRSNPRGSGEEALRVHAVLEACDRSMKAGGVPVSPAEILTAAIAAQAG
jgi:predicted dehydrogenase